MSSITGTVARRAAIVPRAVVAAPISARPFTTTPAVQKTATESVKQGLKKVDRAVSDKIVVGLDAATAAKRKIKHEADEVSGKAEGKADEVKGKAKDAAAEAKRKL